MTRINVGVEPMELCDQHLIAEYHELPRLFKANYHSQPPSSFTLGTGHLLWCSQWQGFLAQRYDQLVKEMFHRGFKVNYHQAPVHAVSGCFPPPSEIERARPIVKARLRERLATMKRKPTWTNRTPLW